MSAPSGWQTGLVVALIAGSAMADTCPEALLLEPAPSTIVVAARPELVSNALPKANRYRVQLESRFPEGQVVARVDTVVEGTRFVPPAPLAGTKAAVKVVVTPVDCQGEAPPVTARGPTFFIDTASACAAPSELTVKGGAVSWKGSGAAGYAVGAFSAEGKVLLEREMRETSVRLPEGAAYASVRARCARGVSAPAYRVIGGG